MMAIALLADTSGKSRFTFLLGDVTVKDLDLSYPQRFLVVLAMAVLFFFVIKLTSNLRDLIRFFQRVKSLARTPYNMHAELY
ncbi:MAG: hypothetical protein K2W88_14465 [Pararheinheimera sp.]|nr:hypothetical protein [Rheinheimera sp.]